jgi:sugar phosphate isomerase/epimerase
MWAMQPRFEHDIHAFVERARDLGYEAVEINNSMDAQMARTIIERQVLPVASIHAPAPLEQHASRGWNRDLNLAGLDEAERSLAVQYTQRSIDLAVEAGAPAVVIHLGHVGTGPLQEERELRALWPERDAKRDEYMHALDATLAARAALAPPHLEAARRSLAELAAYASPRGIALGIESRLLYHEFPLPQEAAVLLAEHGPLTVGYWHDVGHCIVHDRLGLTDLDTWFELLGERLIGAHLHDVRDLVDHRAPGNGSVDYAWLAARLPAHAARTLEIDQHEPDADLTTAIEVLRGSGVIAS